MSLKAGRIIVKIIASRNLKSALDIRGPMYLKLILPMMLVTKGCAAVPSSIHHNDFLTYSSSGYLQMVVEIPAGTNKKIEFDHETNTFPVDILNGLERTINFLPYPGNYGFVPSTMMDLHRGGDGDALDILLLSEHLATGTKIEVIPIGILILEDSGENDSKIIAVPAAKTLRVIDVTSYDQFHSEFFKAKQLIQSWFLAYKGGSSIKFIDWGDEIVAEAEIEKWAN
jgi:inorganic pyrophosphatase